MPNQPISEEERIAREAWDEIQKQAAAQAALLGPAPRTTTLVGEEEVRRWNEIDPQYEGVDARELVAQGMSPAEATLKKYPHRGQMLLSGKTSPKERVKYAQEMERRSQQYRQKQAGRANQALSDGTMEALSRMPDGPFVQMPDPSLFDDTPRFEPELPAPVEQGPNGRY